MELVVNTLEDFYMNIKGKFKNQVLSRLFLKKIIE